MLPSVSEYGVVSIPTPSYSTRRESNIFSTAGTESSAIAFRRSCSTSAGTLINLRTKLVASSIFATAPASGQAYSNSYRSQNLQDDESTSIKSPLNDKNTKQKRKQKPQHVRKTTDTSRHLDHSSPFTESFHCRHSPAKRNVPRSPRRFPFSAYHRHHRRCRRPRRR